MTPIPTIPPVQMAQSHSSEDAVLGDTSSTSPVPQLGPVAKLSLRFQPKPGGEVTEAVVEAEDFWRRARIFEWEK